MLEIKESGFINFIVTNYIRGVSVLKLLLSISFILSFVSCGPKAPESSELNYNAMSWNFKTSGNRSFSSSDKALIKSSMNVLSKRIDQSSVWRCANNNWKRWMVNNSGQNITSVDRFKRFKSLHQRAFASGKIPKVNFVPFNENSPAMGRAYVGGFVKAKYVETTSLVPIYQFSGTFEVKLNLKHLRSRSWQSSSVWAGIIFHEMLHQMGYNHDKGNYADDMYITVIGDCVTSNGRYRSRKGMSLTGGAWPIPD
jgi:hypothetical protein